MRVPPLEEIRLTPQPADAEPSDNEVLEQLERIVRSVHFRNSKRYPALLRYVVEQTLHGNVEHLKERTLGVEVFGRPADYDTSADPVVRFTAAEVRKRIAQYYQMVEHEDELRFELPLGSYVPHFLPPHVNREGSMQSRAEAPAQQRPVDVASQAPSPEEAFPAHEATPKNTPAHRDEQPRSKLRIYTITAGLLLVMLFAVVLLTKMTMRREQDEPGDSPFWRAVMDAKEPSLIILGVHSFDRNGKDISPANVVPTEESMLGAMLHDEMVPVSDLVSYGKLTALLAKGSHGFRTQSASSTKFDQLRQQPIILVGAFNNVWTMRLTSGLRYRFDPGTGSNHEIVDSKQAGLHWSFDSAQSSMSTSTDYAIVSSFYEPQTEQHLIVVAGIGKDGTDAAAEFVTEQSYLQSWLGTQKQRGSENFEAVISTEIVEGQHGPPHVVASTRW